MKFWKKMALGSTAVLAAMSLAAWFKWLIKFIKFK